MIQKIQKKRKYLIDNIINDKRREIIKEAKIKKVCFIISGSRSGSSSLYHKLLQNDMFIGNDGEHGKYYTLNNISYPFFSSDVIPSSFSNYDKKQLLQDIITNTTVASNNNNDEDTIDRLLLLFTIQNFKFNSFKSAKKELMESNDIEKIMDKHNISKELYDEFNTYKSSSESYKDFYVEELPFVLPLKNREVPTQEDFNNKYLLLKTSVDIYRIEWLQKLFKGCEIKWLFLTRNPASAINGLMDGWKMKDGFFTYDVGDCNIKNYRGKLWNYDLPPNWSEFTNDSLESVCYNQWKSANEHGLKGMDSVAHINIKHEDIITNPNMVAECISRYLGYSINLLNNDLIMTTKKPKLYRWKDKRPYLNELIKDSNIIRQLKYEDRTKWI